MGKNVRIGYLDQHTGAEKGMTIRDVLTSAFPLALRNGRKMTAICDRMSEADETQMETYLEELGVIQDMLTVHDFYLIDSKVEEVARALGLTDIGIERDVTGIVGRPEDKKFSSANCSWKNRTFCCWTNRLTTLMNSTSNGSDVT